MKTIKLGQEIKIPETHEEILKNMQNETSANTATIESLSFIIKARKDRMWEIIKQILPETDKYNCQYNSKTSMVKIISKNYDNGNTT